MKTASATRTRTRTRSACSVFEEQEATRASRRRRLVRRFVMALFLVGCTGVRPMQRPSQSVRVVVVRAASPLPEDCNVRIVDGGCELHDDPTGRATLAVVCKSAPPETAVVARASVCTWGGAELEELRRRSCRAGGDTVMLNFSATDSCTRETFDGVQGASEADYTVYRMRH